MTRLFEWTNDFADRLAFPEVLSSDTIFSTPMAETYSLPGADKKDVVTLEKYIQDYFTNILKKAQGPQSSIKTNRHFLLNQHLVLYMNKFMH